MEILDICCSCINCTKAFFRRFRVSLTRWSIFLFFVFLTSIFSCNPTLMILLVAHHAILRNVAVPYMNVHYYAMRYGLHTQWGYRMIDFQLSYSVQKPVHTHCRRAAWLFLLLFVDVNYNMVDYLPPDAQSTTALNIMNSEFTESMPNASVMAKNVSLTEALEYKQKLASIDGVTQVMWLDDMMDIKQPLEMGDTDTIEGFYRDSNALFSVTIAKGMEKEACNDILNLIGSDNALTGEAPALVFIQETTASTVVKALAILLPVVILILVLSTASWLEPLLFLLVIGISIV